MERREKQLRGETAARHQLEVQLDRMANQAVVRRMAQGEQGQNRWEIMI